MRMFCMMGLILGMAGLQACDDDDDREPQDFADSSTGDAGGQDAEADSSTGDAGGQDAEADSSTDDAGGQDAEADSSTDDAGGQDAEADSSTDDAGGQNDFALKGYYASDSATHVITNEDWTVRQGVAILSETKRYRFEKIGEDYVLAKNIFESEELNGLYSRIDWITQGEEIWICAITESANSLTEAEQATGADRSAPAQGGCGEEAWIQLTPIPVCRDQPKGQCYFELMGEHTDDASNQHFIERAGWIIRAGSNETASEGYNIIKYGEGYAILSPTIILPNHTVTYSRFDWIPEQDGHWYYCPTLKDAESKEIAEQTPAPDQNDQEKGCNGNPWIQMTRVR